MEYKIKIGIFGIGLDTYWGQFEGLLDKFPIPARDFIDNWSKAGPSHHCAIGVGKRA